MNIISKWIKKILSDSRPQGQVIIYKFQPGEMQRVLAEHLINTEQILNTEDYKVTQLQLRLLPNHELEICIERKKSPPPPPPPVIVAPPLSSDTLKDDKETNVNNHPPGAGKEDMPERA